jgi:hypothetical protein
VEVWGCGSVGGSVGGSAARCGVCVGVLVCWCVRGRDKILHPTSWCGPPSMLHSLLDASRGVLYLAAVWGCTHVHMSACCGVRARALFCVSWPGLAAPSPSHLLPCKYSLTPAKVAGWDRTVTFYDDAGSRKPGPGRTFKVRRILTNPAPL